MSLAPLLRRVAPHALAALTALSLAWSHVTRTTGSVSSAPGVVHVDTWTLSAGGKTLTVVRSVSARGQALSANLVFAS